MRMLIISEFIAPTQAVASLRWTKLGKYLALDHGVDVDVLTNRKEYAGPGDPTAPYRRDDTLEGDMACFGRFFYLGTPAPLAAFRRLRRGVALRVDASPSLSTGGLAGPVDGLRRLSQRVGPLFAQRAFASPWRVRASGVDLSSYDAIVSSCGPAWPHLIARAEKRRRPGVVWLADFRDPLSRDPANRRDCVAYGDVFADADAALSVSEGLVPLLHARPGQPVHALTNGFDPADRSPRRPLDRFRVSYTGTLYHRPWEREDVARILRLLQSMVDDGEVDPRHLEFVYAGNTSAAFRRQAASVPGLSFPVVDRGVLPRREALDLQQASALLAFSTWNTSAQQGVITGKLWEYLMARVPVVGVCTGDVGGSEARSIVESARAGVVVEEPTAAADTEAARAFVGRLYRQWLREGTTTWEGDPAAVDAHSYPVLARRLMEDVLRPLLGAAPS